MGLLRMGPPTQLLLALQSRMAIKEFIETGTYRGDTAAWAAEHFSRVTTIELSAEYHAAAVARFGGRSHVNSLRGNSAQVLRDVVSALQDPAIFWLDAHWSGLDTAGRDSECPLLEEIAVIDGAAITHAVLVDDARLFCAAPPHPHRADQWPDLASTVAVLNGGGRRHVVLWDDVFVAIPASERAFLTGWLQDAVSASQAESRRGGWWKKLRS